MRVARRLAVLGVAAILATGCAADPGVVTQSADRIEPPATTEPAPSTTASTVATTVPATAPPTTPPPPSPPSSAPPATTPPRPPGELVDVGDAKAPRDYDEFVRLALTDLERWWSEQFPVLYGGPFTPLAGGVYAAYPERTDPIPGCETDTPTPYEDIAQYSAFYCRDGDFIAYDDGARGILYQLAEEFGASILGVVFAHEYGHVVQDRAGALDRDLPTITTEQQADCFAGAWVARVRRGESPLISFDDGDVRNGLVAMITVRDPIGVDQFDEGGHGSAFDRVGAFQTGFLAGPGRCTELLDDPLPLVPNVFRPGAISDGNAAYEEVRSFVPADLQLFWEEALRARGLVMPVLTVVPVTSRAEVTCDDPAGAFSTGALYCPATQEVFLNDPLARDLYDRFGDFVVGYLLGVAYSEAAQVVMGSPLTGEARFLASDCFTGAWASTAIPGPDGEPARIAIVEPGDLDEAIQSALVVGDESDSDDVFGSGFEKIASFREGVLDGFDACTARIGG